MQGARGFRRAFRACAPGREREQSARAEDQLLAAHGAERQVPVAPVQVRVCWTSKSYWDSSCTCPASVATLRGWQSSRVFQPCVNPSLSPLRALLSRSGWHRDYTNPYLPSAPSVDPNLAPAAGRLGASAGMPLESNVLLCGVRACRHKNFCKDFSVRDCAGCIQEWLATRSPRLRRMGRAVVVGGQPGLPCHRRCAAHGVFTVRLCAEDCYL